MLCARRANQTLAHIHEMQENGVSASRTVSCILNVFRALRPFHSVVLTLFAAERLLYGPYRTALAVPLWEWFEDIVFNKPVVVASPTCDGISELDMSRRDDMSFPV